MRVLLIEDNEDHACLEREALTGHTVVHVDRLESALSLADLNGFDVALTDLTLPDARGLESIERLRRQAPDLPLIVLTSMADGRIAQEALGQGAQDYLTKEEIFENQSQAAGLLARTFRYAVSREGVMKENRLLVASLQESKELLERKNERLSALCATAQRFVENVSHDFRTPLTVIKEYSSLICDGVVGDVTQEQRRMLQVVEDRADDLNTMVDDLLDVSKFEAGLLHVWRRTTTMARISEHVLPGLERKAAVRGASLVNSIDESLPPVLCDEEKVGRVIVNLVANAIKFCSATGRIELWARANDERREVIVGVTDNGPGIPPAKLESIFERFSQGSMDQRQGAKGFGLGLSIARELTELNLGRIDVCSVVGQGSTFTFSIPYSEPEEVFARYIRRIRALNGDCTICSPLTITADAREPARLLGDLDVFLSHNVRANDLALRVAEARWLIVLFAPPVEVDGFIARTRSELAELNRNRPLGPLPEIEFHREDMLMLTESLSRLRASVAPLLQGQELCHA